MELAIDPRADGATFTVIVAAVDAPLAMSGRLQLSVLAPLHEIEAEAKVVPAGSVSDRVPPVAVALPVTFVTVTV